MENYNFLPETYYEMRTIRKLKKYKFFILILWLISLVLFVTYTYNSNKYKSINQEIKLSINSKIDETQKGYKQSVNEGNTLSAFKSFYDDIDGKISYNTAIINNKEIDLELTVKESEQYYKIVDKFDNMANYNIVSVSPLSGDNGMYKFRLILEVRI